MGQQGAHICDVNFDNVRVPAENRLGAEGEGFKVAMQVLDRGRLHISARLRRRRRAADRRQRGLCRASASSSARRIAEFQLIQAMIADSKTEAMAASALVLETPRKRDAGENVTLEAAATKLFASEMVGRVADRAVQIFGGAGYVADYGIERLLPRRAHLPHLRGHQPDPADRHRPRDDEARRVGAHSLLPRWGSGTPKGWRGGSSQAEMFAPSWSPHPRLRRVLPPEGEEKELLLDLPQKDPLLLADEARSSGEVEVGASGGVFTQARPIGLIGRQAVDTIETVGGGGRAFGRGEIRSAPQRGIASFHTRA